MRWILLDVAIALLAVALLVGVARSLWRRVTALGREVGRAGEAVGRATTQLEQVQAAPAGVRSTTTP